VEVNNLLLWRVTYAPRVTLQSDRFCSGPWHPSKAYIEQCAASLARTGPVGVQSNKQAATGASTWPASCR